MSTLSSQDIRRMCNGPPEPLRRQAEPLIYPFNEKNLSGAGYDLTSDAHRTCKPSDSILVATTEKITMPRTLVGHLYLRSTFARQKIIASLALIDPGFEGTLTSLLLNTGDKIITFQKGERFLQISFDTLTQPTDKPYDGKYQGKTGIVESIPD